MLTAILLFIGLFLIFLFGYKLAKILLLEVDKLEQISLGYILGLGIFTFIWFLLNWVGIPYILASGLILLLILNIILFIVDKLSGKGKKEKPIIDLSYFKKLNTIEIVLLVIIIFLCILALVQDIYWPIRYWDSLALYDFRAKIFAATGFMQGVIDGSYFLGYPLLTSLAHTWVYLLGGTNPSFIYALLYISLLVNVFFNVKKLNLGRTLTLLLTVMVAVSPRLFDHTQWAYTNLPYSIYIILGSIYLYFGIKKRDLRAFIASAILIGLSTWTRSTEPFWLACIVTASIFSVFIRKWIWPVVYVGLVGLFMLPWRMFVSSYNVVTVASVNVINQVTSTSTDVVQNIQAPIVSTTINFFITNVIDKYFVYFVLLGVILLAKLFIKSKECFFGILISFYLALTLAGTMEFITTNPNHWKEVADSLTRMVMFIPALVVFLLGELLSETKRR